MFWKERKIPSLLFVSLHIVPPEDLGNCIFMRIAVVYELGNLCQEYMYSDAKICVGNTLTLACCSEFCSQREQETGTAPCTSGSETVSAASVYFHISKQYQYDPDNSKHTIYFLWECPGHCQKAHAACTFTEGRPTNPRKVRVVLTNKTGPDSTPACHKRNKNPHKLSKQLPLKQEREFTADGRLLFCDYITFNLVLGF